MYGYNAYGYNVYKIVDPFKNSNKKTDKKFPSKAGFIIFLHFCQTGGN